MVETENLAFSGVIHARMDVDHAGCCTHPTLCCLSERNSMSNYANPTEKGEESIPDQDRADKASDAFMVGVDQHGREHYHSRIRDRMTVLNDGEHAHTEPLDGRPLKHWMAFIDSDEQCGWDGETNVYSGSTIDYLGERLGEGLNGGDH
jgi:hypothetical protein